MNEFEDFVRNLDLTTILLNIDKSVSQDIKGAERDKAKQLVYQTISRLIEVLKGIFNEKYYYMQWDEIIDEFHSDKDIMRRYKFLHQVITQKKVCKNLKCTIFPNLLKIGTKIDSLPVHNLEDAKEFYNKGSPNYRRFERELELISVLLTKVFEEIFKLSAVDNTKKANIKEAFERSKETLNIVGKYNLQYQNKEIGKLIDNQINLDQKILSPEDPELSEDKGLFKKQSEKKKGKTKDEK
jgi:hypothetical protein